MRLNFWFKLTRFVKGSLPIYSNRQNYLLTWKCKQLISAMVMYIDTIYLLITFSRKYLSPLWYSSVQFNRSVVSDFVTPWAAAHQASLSITNSWSLLKLMSIKSVMPSNHLILCCPVPLPPQSFPSSGSFPMSQFFTSGGKSTGVSASASVLPMNIQNWFPLGWAGWISLQSKRLPRVFYTTVQKHQTQSHNPSLIISKFT